MKRLLILDRCDQVRLVLTPFLGEQGYALTFAPDAEAALEALWKEEFTAALVDLTDPSSGGERFLAALRSLGHAGLPCVVLTAEGAAPTAEGAAGPPPAPSGAEATLTKPFDFHEMTMLLSRLTA